MTTKPKYPDGDALDRLLFAYANGAVNDGCMEWEDLDAAFDAACGERPGRYEELLAQLEPEREDDEE